MRRLCLPLAATLLASCTTPTLPTTRAEKTNYAETSHYDDVTAFFRDLPSPLMRVTSIGKTIEGREIPLVIFSDPPVSNPREAAKLHKSTILIQANIHAGEVEGKEAVMMLSRRITYGDLRPLLKNLVVLFIPDYNADGNEKFSVENRTAQYGPVTGVGIRENNQGLDLNRDYMKLDAPESNALVRAYTAWDPLLTVDLHTTDGSYHGYHLTYSIPLNPSSDTALLAYHRNNLMPSIADAMLKKHSYRTEYYGNFTPTYAGARPPGGAGRGGATPPATAQATTAATQPASRPTAWYAFSAAPRVGQNYVGMRNRMTILSEAYSYLDFKTRVEVTEAFVEEILKYSSAHAKEMQQVADRADTEMIQKARAGSMQIGLSYEPKATAGGATQILEAEIKRVQNPLSKRDMTVVLMDKLTPRSVYNYDDFAATRSVTAARAYLFRNEPGMAKVIANLRAHGITVETLSAPLETQVDSFAISAVNPLGTFQNHREESIAGDFHPETVAFPAGSIVIRTDQHLGLLAAYLLEPQSDDGFTRWNFLDGYLGAGKTHPIYKLMSELKAPTHPMGDEGE
ncbi:MAG TPA: M14 family metallopeptidase [Phycisphaerae bacterium]|nr:M14 family metallopeptidase [Phycisphaerae bacterium]